jgi:hypothetical protein
LKEIKRELQMGGLDAYDPAAQRSAARRGGVHRSGKVQEIPVGTRDRFSISDLVGTLHGGMMNFNTYRHNL